jgi:hypothetical protein
LKHLSVRQSTDMERGSPTDCWGLAALVRGWVFGTCRSSSSP